MIKYIGSKRALLPQITQVFDCLTGVASVADLFSGTAQVGFALKRSGLRVLANDHNSYAHLLARCFVAADRDDVAAEATPLIAELNALPGRPGFFTETYCVRSRYFQPKNGARIDAIRDTIATGGFRPELEAVLLASLLQAADRVDSTTGVQMAFLKEWSPRSHNDLELRLPELLPRATHGKGEAWCLDAAAAAAALDADVCYLDPPYNKHSYLGNYHVWESLIRWDRMPVYGIACKREDVVPRRSPFNQRTRIEAALAQVLAAVRSRIVIVSFSNEGFITRERMQLLLGGLWDRTAHVYTLAIAHKRYIGAKIGIYNLQGEKVGKPGHTTNVEYLFVASPTCLARQLAPVLKGQTPPCSAGHAAS